MRSKTAKIKQSLDRAERFKYKTLRRMDKMKLTIIDVDKMIEKLKNELQERTGE